MKVTELGRMAIILSTLLVLSCTLSATGTTSTKIYSHAVLSEEQEQQVNGSSTATIGSCFMNSEGKEKCAFNGQNLNLNSDNIQIFFQEQQKRIKCSRKETPGNGWYGNCDEDADDANFVETNGKIFASIRIGTNICRVSPGTSNFEEIECTPQDEFENEASDEVDEEETGNGFRLFQGLSSTGERIIQYFRGGNQFNDDIASTGSQIDVMVVWTKEAECSQTYGYSAATTCTLDEISENNMLGLINLAVAETNAAFALSGINTQLRLVHAYRHPDYVERGFHEALIDVRKKNDKHLDDVHDKRSLYGADLVSLIVANNAFCGIASGGRGKPVSSDSAFSVVRYNCMAGYYSFGHEIAHNFGAAHDRGTEDNCDVTQYSGNNYGWRDPAGSYRSIMAYDCSSSQCDNNAGGHCTRVQMFSTPNRLYNGQPIGDNNNNVAQYINNNLHTVAGYYPAMICRIDTDCNDNDNTTADTCDESKNVCVYTPLPPPPPTSAPSLTPGTYMDSISSIQVPSTTPSMVPSSSPSMIPSTAPSIIPSTSPSMMPTIKTPQADQSSGDYLESLVVPNVNDSWTTVSLDATYVSPVIVCSAKYNITSHIPVVVRLRNIDLTSFEIRLQNPGDIDAVLPHDCHCLVVEEGNWVLPDGRKIEARSYLSTETDYTQNFVGREQAYQNSYSSPPIILGQVMTYNDPQWSVFYANKKTSRNESPDLKSFVAGKMVGEDPIVTRNSEIVGLIVIDNGHSTSSDIEIETGSTSTSITSVPTAHTFSTAFTSPPAVTVTSSVAMNGGNGGWGILAGDATPTTIVFAVDEDRLSDSERDHLAESLDFIALSSPGLIPLQILEIQS